MKPTKEDLSVREADCSPDRLRVGCAGVHHRAHLHGARQVAASQVPHTQARRSVVSKKGSPTEAFLFVSHKKLGL
jgi:hypothetical protein